MSVQLKNNNFILISFAFILIFSLGLALLVFLEAPNYRNAFISEKNKPARFVTDRNGRILRYLPDEKGCFSVWENMRDIPDVLTQAVITAEDSHFFHHPGFDPLAIWRAIYTNLKHRRKISGASTISQQVVRLLNPRPRTYSSKFIELFESMKLECQLSKKEILELYLNLVPMGGRLQGVGIASRVYFHKDLSLISVCDAACLAIIPRAPTRLDPNHPVGRKDLIDAADMLVHKMARTAIIKSELAGGKNTKCLVSFYSRVLPNEAAHFVDYVMAGPQIYPEIRTTLDLKLQHSIEKVLESHATRLRRLGISQSAVVVVGTEGRKVLAMIGSLNYTGESLGFNNGAIAYRSAGSTLKPFLYALALSRGYLDSSEIPDTLRSYKGVNGDYTPFNSNRVSYGPVSLRSALGNSLNIPAIKMIQRISLDDFYATLQRLGLISEIHGSVEKYGLGLSIGAIDVRLYDLVQAYACLAGGGMFQSLRVKPSQQGRSERIFPETIISQITDILEDPLARILTFGNPLYFDFGFPVAVKTGTSSKYRDAWALAYTSKHVIGIWAGNFDGSTTADALGASSCGPIIGEIVKAIYSESMSNCPAKFSVNAAMEPNDETKVEPQPFSGRSSYKGANVASDVKNEHVYLGPAYARWIYRREKEQGLSRFRLQGPLKNLRPSALILDERVVKFANTDKRVESAIEITSPHDGDRFVLTDSSLRIPFRAQPLEMIENVIWLVDAKEVARTPTPYEFFWTPSRGGHTIVAVTPLHEAVSINIHVE